MHRDQAPVVQTLDSAVHRINHYPADSVLLISVILTHWIVIYPVDSATQRLNNWGQSGELFCMWILVLKGLKQAIEAHTARAYLGLSTVNRPFYQYGGHIEYKGVL